MTSERVLYRRPILTGRSPSTALVVLNGHLLPAPPSNVAVAVRNQDTRYRARDDGAWRWPREGFSHSRSVANGCPKLGVPSVDHGASCRALAVLLSGGGGPWRRVGREHTRAHPRPESPSQRALDILGRTLVLILKAPTSRVPCVPCRGAQDLPGSRLL